MKIIAFLAAVSISSLSLANSPDGGNSLLKDPLIVGKESFKGPETVLWDEKAGVYLVSNVNGKLTEQDNDGFISRVSPEGEIVDLKWIAAGVEGVTLHSPKGMIFHDGELVVADSKAVRFFDRDSGKPLRKIDITDSYLLNELAADAAGNLYVSDTGDKVGKHPGAFYRLGEDAELMFRDIKYDRPNGLHHDDGGLLVAPFGKHADTLYRLDDQGSKEEAQKMPAPQLDGLLVLDNGSMIVTSWKSKKVYRVRNGHVETLVEGVRTPAQIGYSADHNQLVVPMLKENQIRIYSLK